MHPLIDSIERTRMTGRLDSSAMCVIAAHGIPIVQLIAGHHHHGDAEALRGAISRGEVTDRHMQEALDIALARAFS